MQNNELMDRLLGDSVERNLEAQRQASAHSTLEKSDIPQTEESVNMGEIRIISAKYKVYIIILLILMCIFGMNIIPSTKDSYEHEKSSHEQYKAQLVNIQAEIESAKLDKQLLSEIHDNEATLISCLDKKENCSSLPESWNQDLSVPLSYLQATSLHSFKMAVDEKKVLRNLDTYLIRKEIGTSNSRIGDIMRIVIGDPKEYANSNQHFFEVPVSVTIEFENISGLTGFLYNIEKKIIENPEDRILYKVQSVSYDVIAADEPQVADIEMLAYYYYDERFENIDNNNTDTEQNDENIETTEHDENNTETNNTDSNENKVQKIGNKVESFFGGLFNK